MKSTIRIASGQGFWGDLPIAPVDLIRNGPIDYLVMDYLAEVTMSIMHKQKLRDPDAGYAKDYAELMKVMLPEILEKGIRVVSNAGGANPVACKDAVLEAAKFHGIENLKIAVIDGDDILGQIDDLLENGHQLRNMETGMAVSHVKDRLRSANIYFGSRPISEGLDKGADIVITGRVTDTSLILGPLVHEFGWSYSDYDKLSAGTIAGHIIECGAQVSGGNFTDWELVENLAEIGYPIIEASPDGTFYVTKHENSGGHISEMTVKEQLLYEIGDPSSYYTPDVTADFTSVKLQQSGKNRVHVSGVRGSPETTTYKVSASYHAGYRISSTLVFSWPDPVGKARAAGEILKKRVANIGLNPDQLKLEYVGLNSCNEDPGIAVEASEEMNEIMLRISARGPDREELDRLGREIIPLILTGPPGATGYAGGRPKSSEVIAFWPALIEKAAVRPNVTIYHP